MQIEIPCPSGAVFEFKELGGEAIIAVAERVGANASGDTISSVLGACLTRTVDPGPYGHLTAGPARIDWTKLLEGDAYFAMLKLRIESFPAIRGTHEFDFSCSHCLASSGGTVDLEEILADPDTCTMLSEASRATLLAGETFEATVPSSGVKVRFDLKRIAHEPPMRALMRQQQPPRKRQTAVEEVAKQLREVDGLVSGKTSTPVRDLKGLWAWAKKLGASDLDALVADFRAADCGVDPEVRAWCDSADCGREQRIALPFGRSFFAPRTATKKGATGKASSSEPSSPE